MFGSHLSIAGGLHNALLDAERFGMDTVQVFTKNQQQWKTRDLDPAGVQRFHTEAQRLKFQQIVAHDSYLINLASADTADGGLWRRSIAALTEELRRCEALGIAYLVMHPGAHGGDGDDAGLARIIAGLRQVLRHARTTTICLENTAGQGKSLGWRFEHLAEIRRALGHRHLGVCLDTCHLLAAGYDIRTRPGTRKVLDEFDRIVGLNHLKVWHLNDSKRPLAARVDRHEHLGQGYVGLPAFEVICREKAFAAIPKILETPKEGHAPDGRDWDAVNLEILQRLAAGKRVKCAARLKSPARRGDTRPATRRRGDTETRRVERGSQSGD